MAVLYVYENWQAGPRRARIHLASCGHCNDGRGRTGDADPSHGRWHRPFSSYDDAEQAAHLAAPDGFASCGHCSPSR